MNKVVKRNMGFLGNTELCRCELCKYYRHKKIRIAVFHPKTNIMNKAYTCYINTGGVYA